MSSGDNSDCLLRRAHHSIYTLHTSILKPQKNPTNSISNAPHPSPSNPVKVGERYWLSKKTQISCHVFSLLVGSQNSKGNLLKSLLLLKDDLMKLDLLPSDYRGTSMLMLVSMQIPLLVHQPLALSNIFERSRLRRQLC